MPSTNHSIVQVNLGAEFMKSRKWRVMSELSLDLDGRPLTPDLCVYHQQPADFSRDVVRRTDPPLLTVEIFSPTQGYEDVMEKVTHYLQTWVKSCWVVLPPTRSVTIYTPDGSQKTYDEGIVTDPSIGISADLNVVFS